MSSEKTEVLYQRRGAAGTLQLRGIVDIFEATTLLEAARNALADTKAKVIHIDLADTERLDLSALQTLLALQREIKAGGRTFQLENAPESMIQTFSAMGISF